MSQCDLYIMTLIKSISKLICHEKQRLSPYQNVRPVLDYRFDNALTA
jgi:hypothetical protein